MGDRVSDTASRHASRAAMSGWRKGCDQEVLAGLTEREMEAVTTVFRSFETGLREATIYTKVR